MKKLQFIFFVFCLITLGSCNSALDKKYDAKTYEDDIDAIRKSNKVDDGDVELLAKYLLMSKLAGVDLSDKSYGDMLDKLKAAKQNNDEAISNQKKAEENKRLQFEPFLKVELIDKGFSRIHDTDCLTYTIRFKNTSPKKIKTIIGTISLQDEMEKEIKKLDILLDENISSQAIAEKIFTVNYSYSSNNDRRLRAKKLSEMKAEWNPEQIVFENNTPLKKTE